MHGDMVLVAVLVMIGLVVRLAWPLPAPARRRRSKQLDHDPVRLCTEADGISMLGSQAYRQGMP